MKNILRSGLFVFALLAVVSTAHASPSQFMQKAVSFATTSPAYITPGLATSTLAMDTAPGGYALNSLTLLVQQTSSSTPGILNIDFEYSPDLGVDCVAIPTGCDWYKPVPTATTSPTFSLSVLSSYSWTFASSSQGRANVGANANRDFRLFSIQSPTRYIRSIFTVPIGSANVGAWAMFSGTKEIGER